MTMTPEEIKLIYQDMVVELKNSNGGVVGYDIDEVAFAQRIIKAHQAKCQKQVCPECGGEKLIWVNHGGDGYQQEDCPTCQGKKQDPDRLGEFADGATDKILEAVSPKDPELRHRIAELIHNRSGLEYELADQIQKLYGDVKKQEWLNGYEAGKSFATINLPYLLDEAKDQERERIVGLLEKEYWEEGAKYMYIHPLDPIWQALKESND